MIPDLPQAVADNIQQFTGRTWLLPRLLGWLEHPDGHLFFVTGRPGTGKSAFIAPGSLGHQVGKGEDVSK